MTTTRTSTLAIRTPEGVVFALQLASPVTRFLAWSVDLACITAGTSVLSIALHLLAIISVDFSRAITILMFFVAQIGYGFFCEWLWRGQTIGKRMLRLRVVDAYGLRLQFSQIVIRNLLRFVDMLPAFYLVGGIATLLNARTQRLGDLAANTVVIRSPQIERPDLEQMLAGKFNSLRNHPHLEARLRQKITPVEASLALQAILRRDEFEPRARAELFHRLGEYFRSLVEFPPESVESITDEQYLRNVIDTIFRSRKTTA
ncbi:MAG TPA: RDD family protein [Verrucomicrobiae bacterium]|nr:RDD family protein [Verrucomicrobiae bacterium]